MPALPNLDIKGQPILAGSNHPDSSFRESNVVSDAGSQINEYTVQVDDRVYDAKILASTHPGGELFVKAFSGRDATEAFLSYHRREFPHSKMTSALVGKRAAMKKPEADKEFLELCKLVEVALPRNKSFAPISYYLKAFFILFVTFSLEVYMHTTGYYKWYLTAILGWFFALIGLNIQHDSNHGAISRYPIINRLLGMSQNWIGGSAVDWIHQHVVQHHIMCNDIDEDPDIVGSAAIRLNPLKPLLKFHSFQHVYIFLFMGLFGLSYIVGSFQHIVEGFHKTKMSSLLKTNRIYEGLTISFFTLRWLILPFVITPSIYTALHIAPLFMVGGFYLSFFFVISHNFDGVLMFDKEGLKSTDYNESFIRKQVATSSNVGGSWLCFCNGGLNYQIEHHLFPRMHHGHYPKVAPIVRKFCKERNIPYVHFATIGDNVSSCVRHLLQMGTRQDPVYLLKRQQ